MLASGVISIGINFRIATPLQRLYASIKMSSTSSGSSSDSSSDSDSDTEKVQNMKKQDNSTKITRSLNVLIDRITKQDTNMKTVDIALPLKQRTTKENFHTKKKLSYEEEIIKAMENVTNVLSGDKEDIKSQLLDRLSLVQRGNRKTGKQYSLGNLNKLVTNMAVEHQSRFIQKKKNVESWKSRASVTQQLSDLQERKEQGYTVNNTENMYKNKVQKQHQYQVEQKNLKREPSNFKLYEENYTIFKNIKESTPGTPELPVWKSLEQRELALISNQSPKNIFQEMIQWTESGKLWTFPIDNEYGMENESNVHFSEHVFLERHLKNWCPKRGPIRHYMELVCIGLSKNPYMSVDEKIGHITWYKEYFKGKEEILKELGAIDTESNVKEQTKI